MDVDEALDRQLAARIAEAERIAERRFDEVQHQLIFVRGDPAAARDRRRVAQPIAVMQRRAAQVGGGLDPAFMSCIDAMPALGIGQIGRASLGQECVSTCRSRWWPYT